VVIALHPIPLCCFVLQDGNPVRGINGEPRPAAVLTTSKRTYIKKGQGPRPAATAVAQDNVHSQRAQDKSFCASTKLQTRQNEPSTKADREAATVCPLLPLLPRGEVIFINTMSAARSRCDNKCKSNEPSTATTCKTHKYPSKRSSTSEKHRTSDTKLCINKCKSNEPLNCALQGSCPLLPLLPIQGRRCDNCQYQIRLGRRFSQTPCVLSV
jgi:hypothetical protein